LASSAFFFSRTRLNRPDIVRPSKGSKNERLKDLLHDPGNVLICHAGPACDEIKSISSTYK
jgi:hypothetical protein